MDFDSAFTKLLGHEGGYVCHKDDPAGETCWGISKRSYPHEDIKNLTQERAKQIYKRDFWGPAGCETVPMPLRFDLFDTAVNSGAKVAIRLLQRAAGMPTEEQDGVIGLKTAMAVGQLNPYRLLARFNGHRLALMAGLPTWPSFGKGWARRIAENLQGS